MHDIVMGRASAVGENGDSSTITPSARFPTAGFRGMNVPKSDELDSPADYCTVRVMGGLMAVVLPEVPVTVMV